jgi:hypothetical protein
VRTKSVPYVVTALASLAVLGVLVAPGLMGLPSAFGQIQVSGLICSGTGVGCYTCATGSSSPGGAGCTNGVLPPGAIWGVCVNKMYANGCLASQYQNCGDYKDCITGAIVGTCTQQPWCI